MQFYILYNAKRNIDLYNFLHFNVKVLNVLKQM